MGVDAGNEVLAQYRVVEAPVFLHRQVRVACAERGGEDATSRLAGAPALLVHLDPLQTTGRRLLHEDVTADALQFAGHPLGVGRQGVGDVT